MNKGRIIGLLLALLMCSSCGHMSLKAEPFNVTSLTKDGKYWGEAAFDKITQGGARKAQVGYKEKLQVGGCGGWEYFWQRNGVQLCGHDYPKYYSFILYFPEKYADKFFKIQHESLKTAGEELPKWSYESEMSEACKLDGGLPVRENQSENQFAPAFDRHKVIAINCKIDERSLWFYEEGYGEWLFQDYPATAIRGHMATMHTIVFRAFAVMVN